MVHDVQLSGQVLLRSVLCAPQMNRNLVCLVKRALWHTCLYGKVRGMLPETPKRVLFRNVGADADAESVCLSIHRAQTVMVGRIYWKPVSGSYGR